MHNKLSDTLNDNSITEYQVKIAPVLFKSPGKRKCTALIGVLSGSTTLHYTACTETRLIKYLSSSVTQSDIITNAVSCLTQPSNGYISLHGFLQTKRMKVHIQFTLFCCYCYYHHYHYYYCFCLTRLFFLELDEVPKNEILAITVGAVVHFYPRDAMLYAIFATANVSVCPSGRLSRRYCA